MVFNGLSFTIEPCTTTALVGPSGCGKSTAAAWLLTRSHVLPLLTPIADTVVSSSAQVGLLQRFYDPLSRGLRTITFKAQMRHAHFGPRWLRPPGRTRPAQPQPVLASSADEPGRISKVGVSCKADRPGSLSRSPLSLPLSLARPPV